MEMTNENMSQRPSAIFESSPDLVTVFQSGCSFLFARIVCVFTTTMTDLSSVDFKDNVRFIARRDLKSLGVKAPKNKTKTQVRLLLIKNSRFSRMYTVLCLIDYRSLGNRILFFKRIPSIDPSIRTLEVPRGFFTSRSFVSSRARNSYLWVPG